MGACFVTHTFKGELTREQLKKEFDDLQRQDRYENGHSYSGSIGMASGLKITSLSFDNVDGACSYLENTCQKWEEAIAVRFIVDDGSTKSERWIVGAWCAS